jgi:hypothetical protein
MRPRKVVKWLKANVRFSQQTVWNYMHLAKNWDKFQPDWYLKEALRHLTENPPGGTSRLTRAPL